MTIYEMLKEDSNLDIEGLKYVDIHNDKNKNQYLIKVKTNLPEYYNLKINSRKNYFKRKAKQYLQKISLQQQEQNLIHNHPRNNYDKPQTLTPMKANFQFKFLQSNSQNIIVHKPFQLLESINTYDYNNVTILNKKERKNHKKQKKTEKLSHEIQNEQNKINSAICQTPKKQMIKSNQCYKKVKFLQFEFIKDFSQYKTPKKISNLQQIMEPLKDEEQVNLSQQREQ